MTKSNKVCIIYTGTNGLHTAYGDVSKKNMYGIARLIKLEYMIGFYNDDGKFVEELKEKIIIKPNAINFDEEAQKIHKVSYQKAVNEGIDGNVAMKQFMKNLRDVHIIVGHNIRFHLKSIQSECFRTCTYIDFSQFILIDTSTFGHNLEHPSLTDLAEKYNIDSQKPLRILKKLFYKLYKQNLLNVTTQS